VLFPSIPERFVSMLIINFNLSTIRLNIVMKRLLYPVGIYIVGLNIVSQKEEIGLDRMAISLKLLVKKEMITYWLNIISIK
jgi:hypothetical protein